MNVLWSFLDGSVAAEKAKCTAVRNGRGHFVNSYMELAKKIAELQFRNQEHILLFRGQNSDYLNQQGNSKLKPTLFRPKGKKGNPTAGTLTSRFEHLAKAESALVDHYKDVGFLGLERLQRHRILRWSILQHYEICKTPLLDITQSLHIASSFASMEASDEAYIFVLGVPNLSGGITASAESGVQVIRLASVCPPDAVRPHIQEGYLLGEYPDMSAISQKEHYFHYEIDFGRRLVAKFRFDPKVFWKTDVFQPIDISALYPSASHDKMQVLADMIKYEIGTVT